MNSNNEPKLTQSQKLERLKQHTLSIYGVTTDVTIDETRREKTKREIITPLVAVMFDIIESLLDNSH